MIDDIIRSENAEVNEEPEDPIFVRKVFDVVDADGNGFIDWTEFLQAMSILEKCTKKDRLMFLFRVLRHNSLHSCCADFFFLTSFYQTCVAS